MHNPFTQHVGHKFNRDGSAREFAGNTIICPVPAKSTTMRKLTRLRNSILKESWHTHFALLPPSSYHMTAFELVCDQVRTSTYWTRALGLDSSLEEVDAWMVERWLTLASPPVIAMRFQQLEIGEYITIRLEPEDEQVEAQIRSYRNLLAEAFEIRHPNHDTYFFHISLAYGITFLSAEEKEQVREKTQLWSNVLRNELAFIDLLPPRLTFFQDMTHFSMRREDAMQKVMS